jgi:hypothetical protein
MRMLLLLVACTPIIPFYFAESAETLKKGGVSLTVAGGGGGGRQPNQGNGGTPIQNCCGGGAVRVSGGVGRQVELGFETAVIGGKRTGSGYNDSELLVLNKLRLKAGFGEHLALLAGVGVSVFSDASKNTGYAGLGADIGLVWTTGLMARMVRIYGGARFSFVLPLKTNNYEAAPTQDFIVPLGLSFALKPSVRLYVEAGLVGGFAEGGGGYDVFETWPWIGGYGLCAVSYAWKS